MFLLRSQVQCKWRVRMRQAALFPCARQQQGGISNFPADGRKTHDSLFEKSQTVKSITAPCFPSFFINSLLLILLCHLTTVSPWQQKQQNAFSFHSYSVEAHSSLEAEAKRFL